MADLLDRVFCGKKVIWKFCLLVALLSFALYVASYTGISKTTDSPLAPNFAVQIGVVKVPDSSRFIQVIPQEWLVHKLERWPGAKLHLIDGSTCAADAQADPVIVYKTTWRAHLTAFRMVQFLQPAALQPGLPRAPVSRPSTPEWEKDCGKVYDLIVFPFGVVERERFN